MRSDPVPVDAHSTYVARLMASMSTALLAVFLAAAILTALPPRLLDSEWQLMVSGALINNGALALLGFLLVTLAVWIDPESRRLNARANAFRRWSTAAALGYLLLAPVQGFATWQVRSSAEQTQSRAIVQADRQFTLLREVISSSLSPQELSERIAAAPGGSELLPPRDLDQPLPQLRQEWMANVERAEQELKQRSQTPPAIPEGPPARQSLRMALSALAYAYAFAFASGLLRWGPNRFAAIGKTVSVVDENYYQKLSNDKPAPSP